jgi:tetratricopeptide (TPR) repeat protein
VIEDRELDRLLRQGRKHLEHGAFLAAIEAFRRALSIDPELVDGHALLALALYDARRLSACELEAGRALVGDPESPLAHLAMAFAAFGARRWDDTRRHAEAAVGFAPDDPFLLTAVAELHFSMDELDVAQSHAERALRLGADGAGAHVVLGRVARHRREVAEAMVHANTALEADPGDEGALVLRGWLHLDRGETSDAREHALWALREAPESDAALRLLVGVKMQESPVTGLWFRFNAFVSGGSRTRMVAWLVGLYLLKGLLVQVFRDLDLRMVADVVSLAWLGFCVYTWFGPAAFRRSLEAELRAVRLRDDF